jgi:hypothetical protein
VSELTYYTKLNDAIKGERIVLEARKIKKVDIRVKGTHKHTVERAEGKRNARAWVEIEVYPTGEFKLST